MAKQQLSFWPLFLEFISVVFAVLLALGLNSYKQTHDLKKESDTLSKKIIAECTRNLEELDSVNIDNNKYLAYLDSILVSNEDIRSFRIDINGELLNSSAWKYTQNSPAFNHIDNQLLDKATQVYELQEYYMKVSGQMFETIGQMQMFSDNIESNTLLKTCHYYTRNVVSAGEQLEKAYEEILADHQKK